ncbi:MAG: ribonuclease III [Gammaproteobacteria bacterium]|nr:ribonuclease III [Gammaproteobacteria bacterium]
MSLNKFQKKLGYSFNNINLLELALVHKSSNNKINNERLEFLGDSILNTIISEYLFNNFPNEKEGLLTRMRSYIVCGETLTKKAQYLDVLNYIKLSKGTANLSNERKQSILEGALESIIGAVFLDSSWQKVQSFTLNLFNNELSNIGSNQEFRDSKTELQELLQSKNNKTPIYSTKEFHSYFESTVIIENNEFSAHGRSKRQAETNAAKEALNYLKSKND